MIGNIVSTNDVPQIATLVVNDAPPAYRQLANEMSAKASAPKY